ncbi:hypothetical protein [Paratractidigestivibacter sp.]|uniref:hypothetical protein n=1 Tax=Paratractidigestivibacter sp. TaxID=2847316 RepID=UPI002ABD9D5C|nr:hypothetical protein [Paratractidigestivibacter sp.]
MAPSLWLTPAQFAQLYQLPERTARKLANDGGDGILASGNRRRFDSRYWREAYLSGELLERLNALD